MSNLQAPGGGQPERNPRSASNPLPGLASLDFNNSGSDAQRSYEAAEAARTSATQEEIEQRGIVPDVNLIEREILRPKSRISSQRARADSTAHKIFVSPGSSSRNTASGGGSSNVNTLNLNLGGYPSNIEQDSVVNTLWEEFAKEGGLDDLDYKQVALLHRHWQQRALAINESAKEWKALNEPEPEAAATPSASTFDLFGSLMTDFELLLEVCKHLRPIDIINLYSVSKAFHNLVNSNLQSTILLWTDHMAPSSARIFCHQLYYQYFIDDPSGRDPRTHRDIRYFNKEAPNRAVYECQLGYMRQGPVNPFPPPPAFADNPQHGNSNFTPIRKVPSLIWFQMVVDREIKVRDILATMARHGHRTPPDTHKTVKKLWLLMDVASCRGRAELVKSKTLFTDEDLYRARLFFVKLCLLFTDPVFGPKSTALAKLFLGQKGFTPLWEFLRRKKYQTEREIVEMKTRYDIRPQLHQVVAGKPINGVPLREMGMMHVEGWGRGARHLMRPDQIVTWQAYKRRLPLHLSTEKMMLYGHVDFKTGRPLVPSLDEMYMSDDEFDLPAESSWRIMKHRKANGGCGNVPFERSMWQPKHARKARWSTLTEEEKEDILAAEEEEMKEAKDLRYIEGDLDVALADLEEALYDYAVEKEEGSHEEEWIDGLDFDSRVPMPDDASPSDDDEEDFDDEDWEACAKYMEGLGPDRPVPDQMTLIRQDKAQSNLDKSLLVAKQVFDSMAETKQEKAEQDKAWNDVVNEKWSKIAGKDPRQRKCAPVAPRNPTAAAQRAFEIATDTVRHGMTVPLSPEQAEWPDVRAEYLIKAAAALNKAKLDTGDLDPSTDAMPDDEVAELEDEMILSELEETVNHGWMLHMPRNQGGGNGSNGQNYPSVEEPPVELPVPQAMDEDLAEEREAFQEMLDMEEEEDRAHLRRLRGVDSDEETEEEDDDDEDMDEDMDEETDEEEYTDEETDEDEEEEDDEEEEHYPGPLNNFNGLATSDFNFVHTPVTPNFNFPSSPSNFGGLHNPTSNPNYLNTSPTIIPPFPTYASPNNNNYNNNSNFMGQPNNNIRTQANPHQAHHSQPNHLTINDHIPHRPIPNVTINSQPTTAAHNHNHSRNQSNPHNLTINIPHQPIPDIIITQPEQPERPQPERPQPGQPQPEPQPAPAIPLINRRMIPTPNPAPNPHNPDLPYPAAEYHYSHDPDTEDFDWRGWLEMQHRNDLVSEAARLDPTVLHGAHEAGPEEVRRRAERVLEERRGYRDWRERELRMWYREW